MKKCFCETGEPVVTREVLSDSLLQWMVSSDPCKIDNDCLAAARFEVGIVIDVRNGSGYLRLVDVDDYNCLDHAEKIEIKCCPICGRVFKEQPHEK